jgi:hypothetical protein
MPVRRADLDLIVMVVMMGISGGGLHGLLLVRVSENVCTVDK